MKKVSFLFILFFVSKLVTGQLYYNEWIDYAKTYYKFKVGSTGLYRITTADLANIGLGNTPAENFQVWRNGKQVPLFTSNATGALGSGGYIEFWGERNDGVPDKDLYRLPTYQLSTQESLITDTAAFFLTTGTEVNNARFAPQANNVAGNTLAAEPYFWYAARQNFKDRIHKGIALVAGGEYVYSSSYDMGEMWASADIYPATPAAANFSNLFVAPSGPPALFRVGAAGSSPSGSPNGNPARDRRYTVSLNGTNIIDTILNQFESRINYNNSVSLSLFSTSNSAAISIKNASVPTSVNPNDRIVCNFVELKYPRLFNFNNQANFAFSLSQSLFNRYLEITNFNAGGTPPVLYDLTSQRRYVADVSGSVFRFVILPSSGETQFVLVSQVASNPVLVNSFQTRNFINYDLAANQGNYLMITNNMLRVPYAGADQVEAYRQYRSSIAGGSYSAQIYDINELVDQFGYGIKKNPQSIKNFLRFARNKFSFPTQYAFLVGRGLNYSDYRENEINPQSEQLNLVPTFGYPASDILLASNTLDPVMNTYISRISVVSPHELADYLDKVKQYEQAQQSPSQTIGDKAWMKNIVHVVGANDPNLDRLLTFYMNGYQRIIEDTMFGGKVYNFNKTSTGPATPIVNSQMASLFETGLNLISYFGHSSATSLDYNLDDPSAYNNTGKYPFFLVSGCLAGDLYYFDAARFTNLNTLSEKFVLAPQKGGIGFIASTSFGIDTYLNFYNSAFYRSVSTTGYGKPITFNMSEAINAMNASYSTTNMTARLHAEENTLNGDPVLKFYNFAKPDYVVEQPQVQIIPNVLSVADTKFTVKANFYNIGKATNDSVTIQIKRKYSNGADTLILKTRLKPVRDVDSISLNVPISGLADKGTNQIIVTIDPDNQYDELSELNNTTAKSFTIFEDELTPVYPANFAIINKANAKVAASTANPLVVGRQYLMEMDTTELFNSSFKISKNIVSTGGLIEFDPGITYTDSTVYYWRVAPVSTTDVRWKYSSFVYLNGTNTGYNQSHFYQHTKSTGTDIYIDTLSRSWKFTDKPASLTVVNSIYPTSGQEDNHFSISVNGLVQSASACLGHSVIFNVFDPVSFKQLYNQAVPSTVQSGPLGGFMGSASATCGPLRQYNFEFSYLDTTGRRKMRDFMDWVPAGYYVTARLILDQPYNTFVSDWQNDEAVYGTGNSAYSRLKSAGFADFDNFTSPRTWAFVYRKNNTTFTPESAMSAGLSDRITMNTYIKLPGTVGTIASPLFGPAKTWKDVKWRGFSVESNPKDVYSVKVIGYTPTGNVDTLFTLQPTQQDFNISSVSATQYPYLQLFMNNQEMDSVALTPYQLRYWRLYYDPLPEGAIAPNLGTPLKDTLQKGESLSFTIPFKNISDAPFTDSIKVNLNLELNGTSVPFTIAKRKALQPGDTTNVTFNYDTKNLSGLNTLTLDFNPANDQPEVTHFNNFLVKNFFVNSDVTNPLMDVTFNGVHILNNDIVSAKPKIVVKLKDESKFLRLDDTALATVYVRYPNSNALVRFPYGTDTLKFIPADASSGKNEASIEFAPSFLQDSQDDPYELVVKAKDKSGNPAGNTEYNVRFNVINKPMISNMFNYPNPFTSSTAFVFTITGSQVPQNIRIQILTITGKVVRDITMQELGPLHIGRNITEYKWDGTDQFGSKLANGVYLYRVLTNLNGASLEKYNTIDASGSRVNTDQYFNKGYGKMYLMR